MLFVLCYVFGLGKFLPEKQFQYCKNLSDKYGKYEEIMKLIEEDPIATYNATEIDDAKLKDDMGIDSLDFVDIVVIVEKNFGFKIKPEEMKDVTTLSQFCDYIESKVG